MLPWWPALWEHNYFAMAWPPLRTILINNFVRGGVSGLGVVNLFAGFADLASLLGVRPPGASGPDEPVDERNSRAVLLHDDTR